MCYFREQIIWGQSDFRRLILTLLVADDIGVVLFIHARILVRPGASYGWVIVKPFWGFGSFGGFGPFGELCPIKGLWG